VHKNINNDPSESDKIKETLKNTEFKILKSYIDIHPFSGYSSICKYMNVR
jgi:hypothetical protein